MNCSLIAMLLDKIRITSPASNTEPSWQKRVCTYTQADGRPLRNQNPQSTNNLPISMVLLVITQAPILPGNLRDCARIVNSEEDGGTGNVTKCSQGGLPAVNALHRKYTASRDANETALIVPLADYKDPLTIMSRFGFGVNVLIFGELGYRTWTCRAYTLWPDRILESAVYHTQDPLFPAVLSNVVTSPVEAAHQYVKSIHWDEETKLALIYLTVEYLENTLSHVQTTQRLLQYVYKKNQAMGCDLTDQPLGYTVEPSGYSAFIVEPFSEWFAANPDPNRNVSYPLIENDSSKCFLPVIVFDDIDKSKYEALMDSLKAPTNFFMGDDGDPTLFPHLLVDLHGHALSENETISISQLYHETTNFSAVSGPTTWIVSYSASPDDYYQLELSIAEDKKRILNVQTVHEDLNNLPLESKTPEFYADLAKIRQYAREALESSLANEPGVRTDRMPEITEISNGFRRCYVGECELGNLVADAVRWASQTDIALLPSFMFDGPGWNAGMIRTLELLENIPYTVPRCTATLNGNSLLRLLNYSISTSSFDPFDSVPRSGGRFLQVSGIQFSYNNELKGPQSKILAVNVWDQMGQTFVPLDRSRLYTLASCNHLCFTFVEFPEYLGSLLVDHGEKAAVIHPDSEIKTDVKKFLEDEYYSNGNSMYQPRLEGRITTDFNNSQGLVIGERQRCIEGESYWDTRKVQCMPCPLFSRVQFSDNGAVLIGQAFAHVPIRHSMLLTNAEDFGLIIQIEAVALQENIRVTTAMKGNRVRIEDSPSSTFSLEPKQSLRCEIEVDPSSRSPGTDTSTLVFYVQHQRAESNCNQSHKMVYDIQASLFLSKNMNTLGDVASFGYTASAVIVVASVTLASWVYAHRKTRVVSSLQPHSLIMLCFGIFLLGSSLIVLSIDDGAASQRGCDAACTLRPWLLSMGFNISTGALFSKLYRLNKLFNLEHFRRVQIRETLALLPTGVLLALNLTCLLVWTILDPMRWTRVQVPNQPWSTYGTCSVGDGKHVGKAMLYSTIALCALGFLCTVGQAYKARNISSEFSESRYLGIAVFSWVQLLIVGIPMMFLVDDDSVVARYSVVVGLVIAVCLSMLLAIFAPMLYHTQRKAQPRSSLLLNRNCRRSNIVHSPGEMGRSSNSAIVEGESDDGASSTVGKYSATRMAMMNSSIPTELDFGESQVAPASRVRFEHLPSFPSERQSGSFSIRIPRISSTKSSSVKDEIPQPDSSEIEETTDSLGHQDSAAMTMLFDCSRSPPIGSKSSRITPDLSPETRAKYMLSQDDDGLESAGTREDDSDDFFNNA